MQENDEAATDGCGTRAGARGMRELIAVTAALSRTVTARDVGRVVATRLAEAVGATAAAAWVVGADGRTLEALAPRDDGDAGGAADTDAAGADGRAVAAPWTRVDLEAAMPVAEVVRTGQPIWLGTLEALASHWPALAIPAAARPAASAVLPLAVECERPADAARGARRMLGVLWVWYGEGCRLDADDRALLDAVAAQAAQALERARLYAAERAARGDAERLRHDAERANQAKSEFVATMSHELRTPLNAISGHVDLLEMGVHGALTEPQLAALGRVRRAQEHLLGLINDVLNYARLEGGRVEYDIRPVALASVLADLRPMVEPQAAARQLAWQVDVDDTTQVAADADKLRQILLNLLSNAVKFTEPGGRIEVEVARRAHGGTPDDVAFVRVRDTGRGIPPERIEAIFEPFVQVRTGYTRGDEGTGLGLAISRDLARGMGGDLRARSVEREGSAFTLTLRRAAPRDDAIVRGSYEMPGATPA